MGITIITPKYYSDFISLCYNHDWSSHALDILHEVSDAGKGDDFMELLIDMFGDEVTDDDVENFFYYDDDWIREELKLNEDEEDEEDETYVSMTQDGSCYIRSGDKVIHFNNFDELAEALCADSNEEADDD